MILCESLVRRSIRRSKRSQFEKCIELVPDFKTGHNMLGRIYLAQSKPQEALVEMQKEADPGFLEQGLVLAYHALGKKKEAMLHLPNSWSVIGGSRLQRSMPSRGERDKAFEWLEYAYQNRDGDLKLMKGDPLLRNLHNDPRWPAFLKKLNLHSEHWARPCPFLGLLIQTMELFDSDHL